MEEGAAGQSPQGEPHGEGPHQDVSRELRGSVLGLPSASVGRAPERVQLLRAGPGAPGGGRQAPPRRAGDLGHRGWARPLPRPFTLKPPGRLRLGWGWGRRWRVRVLEVWNNDGGVTAAPPVSSFSQGPLGPSPVCGHGQQESSGHRAPLPPPPRPRRNNLQRDEWGPVPLRCRARDAVPALSAAWRAQPIAAGARATRLPRESSGPRPRITLLILLLQ